MIYTSKVRIIEEAWVLVFSGFALRENQQRNLTLRSRDNLSTSDEAFLDSTLPTPPDRPPLWGPGPIPDMWADV